jgi:hypothetical protein
VSLALKKPSTAKVAGGQAHQVKDAKSAKEILYALV